MQSTVDLREALWRHDRRSTFLTRTQYLAGLREWDVKPHTVQGETVAVVATKGPEFHYVTLGSRWTLTRSDLRALLQPILDEHGCVRTRTPVEDTRQQRFNERIGFERAGVDEFYIYYEMKVLRLAGARRNECP